MHSKENKIYISDNLYYTIFQIKNRIIYSPCEELKKEQRYFLNAIKWGYPLKISTLKTAKIHKGKKWILKLDIKNFYESVPYHHIKLFVNKICSHIKNADVDYYYLNLVTVNKKLPTGAPTSAHIANKCFEIIDKQIRQYCIIWGIDYSRYMDDLVFSFDDKRMLNILEKRVEDILDFYGYKLNSKKTKYISDNKQQNILGLVVNGHRTRISNDFKRKIRAMLYNYVLHYMQTNIRRYDDERKLKGYISYIKSVDKKAYSYFDSYALKLYKRFGVDLSYLDII